MVFGGNRSGGFHMSRGEREKEEGRGGREERAGNKMQRTSENKKEIAAYGRLIKTDGHLVRCVHRLRDFFFFSSVAQIWSDRNLGVCTSGLAAP